MKKVTYSDRRNSNDWCYKYTDNENEYKVYFSAGYPRVEFLKYIGDIANDGTKSHRVVGSVWENTRIDIGEKEHFIDALSYFELNKLIEMIKKQNNLL